MPNLIDILLILAFVATIGAGFIGGTIRLMFVLVSLYLGVVVSGFFYIPIAASLSTNFSDITPYTAQLVSFFLLLSIAAVVLALSLFKTFQTLRLPNMLASMDQVGGAVLGVVTATFAVVVVTVVLSVFFTPVLASANSGVAVSPILLSLADQMRTSGLSRYFVELSEPLFVIITPWFPNGMPEIMVIK
jgi:uncharacterized membrane protein required for colicin V production